MWAIKTIFFTSLVAFIISGLIVYFLYYSLTSLIDQVKLGQHPQSEIIQTLCYFLIWIEENSETWNYSSNKYFITFYLEYIAKIVEDQLFYSLLANHTTQGYFILNKFLSVLRLKPACRWA